MNLITNYFKKQNVSLTDSNVPRSFSIQKPTQHSLILSSSPSDTNKHPTLNSPPQPMQSQPFASPPRSIHSQQFASPSSVQSQPFASPPRSIRSQPFASPPQTMQLSLLGSLPSSSQQQSLPQQSPPPKATSINLNDIGLFINCHIKDNQKYELLKNHFEPGDAFKWPYSEGKLVKNGQTVIEKRFLNESHLVNNRWLKYSSSKQGLFCVPCAIFSTTTKQCSSYGKLVYEPLKDYKKLLGKSGYIAIYSKLNYHLENMPKAEHFLFIYYKQPDLSIQIVFDDQRQQQIVENRARLRPIIETLLLCGRQNFPLRGHRDDGVFFPDNESVVKNGNFRSLLHYGIESGDQILRDHLKSCDKNATYISKTVQNQLIEVIGNIIIKQIIDEVREAKYFTVLLDETADIANKEHFIHIQHRSGSGLANSLMNEITNLGLNLELCVGQGYDGCSAMAGHTNGCQAVVRQKYPQIIYVHCASHSLNLALSDSCGIRFVENTVGTIKGAYNFFHASSVRTELLHEHAKSLNSKRQDLQNHINSQTAPEEHIFLKKFKTKLANVCITRWVERHTSVNTFYSLYPAVIEALEELIRSGDKEVSTKANLFRNSLLSSDFLCTLPTLNKLLTFTVNVSRALQSRDIDLLKCIDTIEDVIQVLQMIRNDPNEEYQYIFQEAVDLAQYTGTSINMPRLVSKQWHRNNIPAHNEYEYYKLNLFVPLLDHFLASLRTRFSVHVKHAAAITCIIPKFIHEKSFDDLKPAVELYQSILPGSLAEIRVQFLQWKNKWINIHKENQATWNPQNDNDVLKRKPITIPDTAIDSFNEYNKAFFPNIKALLQIFSTLPVSTATVERSFSVLKQIKTYLRSTMAESRLNGLALMYIYRDKPIDVETVITEFSRSKHRIDFAI